jgi:hypothetical protein
MMIAFVAAVAASGQPTVPPAPQAPIIVYAPPRAADPAAQPAQAKPVDPAALASAKRLLAMMHMNQTIDRMIGSMVPVMAPAILGMLEHDDTTRAVMEKMESQPDGRNRLMAIFSDEFLKSLRARYPSIIDSAAQEYAATFTARELDQAIAFYSTPTGAKFLALQPQLQQTIGTRAGAIGREAGMEAGQRAMLRAVQDVLPSQKTGS